MTFKVTLFVQKLIIFKFKVFSVCRYLSEILKLKNTTGKQVLPGIKCLNVE